MPLPASLNPPAESSGGRGTARWSKAIKAWFFVLAFTPGSLLQADNADDFPLERVILTGLIDSDGERGYWEKRRRYPTPGIVITSETYVRIAFTGRVSSNGSSALEDIALVDVFDVYRIELAGNISSAEYRELEQLQRIALAGTISNQEQYELARRFGLDGTITNSYQELVERYGLTGIISNTDDTIELAYLRRQDVPTQRTPGSEPADLLAEIEEAPVVRDGPLFWSRGRNLLAIIEPTLTTYLRRDEIDREGFENKSSTLVVVRPYLRLALQQPKWSLTSHYEMESGSYLSGENEGFINHELATDWGFRSSRRNQFNVAAVYRNWQDRRTRQAVEDFNAGLVESFDYDSLGFNFRFRHGTKEDRRRYDVSAQTERTKVDSGNDVVFGYDLVEKRLKATGYWRVRRRITLLLNGEYKSFDYQGRDDSRQYRITPGVEFVLPRRIAGRALMGYEGKRDTESNASFGSLVWDADLTWRPWRRTSLEVRSARELLEVFARAGAILAGEFGVQQYGKVTWSQQWNSAWNSRLGLTYQERGFEGIRRGDEKATQLSFQTSYRVTPRLTLRGDGVYTSQRAQDSADNFDRWTVTFKADMGLYRGRR
jgi:hypothetical protein